MFGHFVRRVATKFRALSVNRDGRIVGPFAVLHLGKIVIAHKPIFRPY